MLKNRIRLIIILAIVVLVLGFAISNIFMSGHEENALSDPKFVHETIVNNTTEPLGSVEVIKNIGNPNGQKIAYVVGVHPLENDTHKTFLKMIPTLDTFNNCYDVYIINLTEDFSQYGQLLPDDQPGRATGQDMAYKYVYPQIVKGGYKMACDVHAHGGAYGDHNTFVFCPVSGGVGESLAMNVSKSTQNVSYYDPEFTTSGPYLTIPLNENGVPAFYFEENSFFSQDVKDAHMLELIHAIDNLSL
ncbi:hypothetical protein [Methanobrevibacter sp.]|uniref:hypothetical protein n=1 Tax=Methanobrevibacter sp. TaxID=66852 RepID=UPI00388DC802